MTALIKERRYGHRFVEIRKQTSPGRRHPASARAFPEPAVEIDVQGIAVIGDRA
jgi:hypothetical protein